MSDQAETGCPPLADLISATEGAMPPEDARSILTHLRICGLCREELRQTAVLTGAAADYLDEEFGEDKLPRCMRFRQELETTSLPEPSRLSLFVRRLVRLPGSRWLSAAAIGPLVLAGIMLFNTSMAVVQADALLERVVLESHTRPAGLMQRVQVTVTPVAIASAATWSRRRGTKRPDPAPIAVPSFTAVRQVVDGVALAAASPAQGGVVELPPALKRLFDLQPVDWQRPLDVDGLRGWRRALSNKHDEIRSEGDRLLVLRTTTTEGLLREVSLVVERKTYRVIRQLLVFEGIGQVEIAELAQWDSKTTSAGAGGARAAGDDGGAGESAEAAATHDRIDRGRLDRSEIDARIALREAGVDLGGLVRVARDTDGVRIDGVVSGDAQRRDLGARLSALPGVRVSLRAGDAAATNASTSTTGVDAGSGANVSTMARPALARWLAHTFEEGATARARFVPELTQLVSRVAQRLTALQDLAERYQLDEIHALSRDARGRLQLLLNMHYEALNRDLLALDSRVAVLFGSTERCLQTQTAPSDWSQRAVTGLTHARTLERQVQELLTHDDLPAPAAMSDGEAHVGRTFGALWNSVNAKASSRNLIARGPSPST